MPFQLRLGTIAKHYQNVNIFLHSGKLYATGDNYLPQEVGISTLESLDYWDVNGAWDRPFTSHPKVLSICLYYCQKINIKPCLFSVLVIPFILYMNQNFFTLQKAPGSGELVMLGFDGMKPYCVVGVISGMYDFIFFMMFSIISNLNQSSLFMNCNR